MRPEFFRCLHEHMRTNENIIALTGDLGFVGFDKIREDFPDRFYNCGAAEQAMIDIGIGLAMSGKIPFIYSISPFLILRPFESIRTYMNHENIPIKLIGSGQTEDCYKHEGFSHYSADLEQYLFTFDNIQRYYPRTQKVITWMVDDMIENKKPSVMLLRQK